MSSSPQLPHGLRFGIFEIDLESGELRKNGLRIKLQEQPFKILAAMARRAGQLIPREELYEELSSHSTYDFKHGLNNAIQKIREVLGDSPENARFIETVPGRGYRFLPQVEVVYKPSVSDGNRIPRAGNERSVAPIVDLKPAPARVSEHTHPSDATHVCEPGLADSSLVFIVPKADTPGIGKRRRWWMWIGTAVLLIVGGLYVYFHVRLDYMMSESVKVSTNGVKMNFVSTGLGDRKIMLVVVPFVNMSGDPSQKYLADGMTEEMIMQLSRLNPQRLVVGRYKGVPKDAGHMLPGVDYFLEGSVHREGNRVRVTALLIHAHDETYSWAESYDRDFHDVLKMQSAIAQAIAGETQIALSKQVREQLDAAPRVNAEAHMAYLLGLQAITLRTKAGIEAAITDFKQSIAVDPNYAPAYAGLARAYNLASIFGVFTSAESFPQATSASTRALALDDTLSDAHNALAFTKAHWKFDWAGAEREFRKSIDLEPNSAWNHFTYANSYLTPLGHHDEAISEVKKAIALDPLFSPFQSFLGRTYALARRDDDALAQLKRSGDTDPNIAINHVRLAHLYSHLRRYQDAIAEETLSRVLSHQDLETAREHGRALTNAFQSGGPRGYWLKELEFAGEKQNPPEAYVTPFGRAIIYSELGDKENALKELKKAYDERDLYMIELTNTEEFDFLQQEPEFKKLLQLTGLGK